MEKLEHFRHILLSSIEGRKQWRRPETCAVYGDNVIEKSTARIWFSRFKEDRFDTSDTQSQHFMKSFHLLKIKIGIDCMPVWNKFPVNHTSIFHQTHNIFGVDAIF